MVIGHVNQSLDLGGLVIANAFVGNFNKIIESITDMSNTIGWGIGIG